jgi:F0F1-type ATP synthase assembly protein I
MFNKASSAYVSLGFELIGLIGVLVYIGRLLDQNYGWPGWGVVGGVLIGFTGWVVHVYVVVQMLAKAENSGDTNGE